MLKFLDGYKTYIAGIGVIFTGLAMIADGLATEPVDTQKIYNGILTISAGLAACGIGHKLDKGKTEQPSG